MDQNTPTPTATATRSGRLRRAVSRNLGDVFFIVIGIALYALGFTAFVLPHGIVIGGMTGLGTLVYFATGGAIPVAVTMYGVNILLLVCALKVLGRGFVVRTVFGATLLSLAIGAVEGYFTSHAPLVSSAPMSVMIGSVLMGLGIGVYYSHHGSAGGTDVIAAVISTFTDMSVGRIMMFVDVSIVALSFFLPFDGNMEARIETRTETIIYGWLSILIYSALADRYLKQGRQTVQFIIISDRWQEIGRRITHEAGRGVTMWDASGFWTGEPRRVMMVWCRQPETATIYRIVHESDSRAYITGCNVNNVYGNGFDTMKTPRLPRRRPFHRR